MNHHDRMKRDINETYARRDRDELTEEQWLDKLREVHDEHKAACEAEWNNRNGGGQR